MAEQTPEPGSLDASRAAPTRPNATGMPRWVRIVAIVGIAVVMLLALALMFGGGQHGPSRHTGSGGHGDQAISVSLFGGGSHRS